MLKKTNTNIDSYFQHLLPENTRQYCGLQKN